MTEAGKKTTWLTAGAVITIVTTIVGFTWSFGGAQSLTTETMRQQNQMLTDHESRIRNLERTNEQMASDIRWIRQSMERERRQP